VGLIDFLQNLLDGVAIGAAYALLALGFTLIFGVMKRLNIAFGPSIMVGIFVGIAVHGQWSAGLFVAAGATVFGAVAASLYVERICFAAIRSDAVLASMVSSFAIWMQLEEAVSLVFPARTYAFPVLTTLAPIEIAEFYLRIEHLITLIVAGLLMVGLHALLTRTHFGLELRAVSDSAEAARVSRVNVRSVALRTFLLAAAVGGVAGFLIAASEGVVTTKFGLWATVKGLTAMVLGGLGSVRGAVLGGLLLGVVETQAQWYLGAAWREIATYALLFAALVLLPGGLAGRRLRSDELEAGGGRL
jgi:branched-chain amino acid transport system permease protein